MIMLTDLLIAAHYKNPVDPHLKQLKMTGHAVHFKCHGEFLLHT